MSRAKFGLSKILKLTSSRSGQPPRAGQAHCHDSISLGGLPGLLLHLSSPTLQKSSESAGYSHRSPGRCPIPLWKTLALKTVSGILPGMTCSFSLCHLRSHWHGDDPQCREAYLSWVSGSTLSSQITHLLGAVTDLDAPVVMETKIVIWRKGPVSLKTLHIFLCYENIIYLLL